MKKILLMMSMVIFMSVSVWGQDKEIIFNIDTESSSFKTSELSDFYVLDFKGQTSHTLYENCLLRISHLYNSPQKVTEVIQDKAIIINGHVDNITHYKLYYDYGRCIDNLVSMDYKLSFYFKDGKVRVDAPYISKFYLFETDTGISKTREKRFLTTFYRLDPSEAVIIKNFFNDLITKIVYGNPTDEDW